MIVLGQACELIRAVALDLPAFADTVLSALLVAYAGGMPDGLGADGLAAATAAAAAAAGGAAAYGPHLPSVSAMDRYMGNYRYRDSAGNPYWPGISPIPPDGIVYPPASDVDRSRAGDRSNSPERGGGFSPSPIPVGPRGMPIYPPPPNLGPLGPGEAPIAAIASAGRG